MKTETTTIQPRRETIIDATLQLLRAQGPRAVTHRAVADAADVPLAATTYYFSSKDELLEEALRRIAGEEVERMGAQAAAMLQIDGGPSEVAALLPDIIAGALSVEEDGMLPKFEMYLEAARRPALRQACDHWITALRDLAATALRLAGASNAEVKARVFVAGIDGALVHRLATGQRPYPDEGLRAELEALISGLLAS